jgi:hypothetical protein
MNKAPLDVSGPGCLAAAIEVGAFTKWPEGPSLDLCGPSLPQLPQFQLPTEAVEVR